MRPLDLFVIGAIIAIGFALSGCSGPSPEQIADLEQHCVPTFNHNGVQICTQHKDTTVSKYRVKVTAENSSVKVYNDKLAKRAKEYLSIGYVDLPIPDTAQMRVIGDSVYWEWDAGI